jgi:predicted nuclease with TOPRIM domain
MQEKTIKELRQELKEQIKENQELIAEIKELNVDNEWWNNRYKAQVRINEEHQKINGELRKEIDGLVTVIDLVREYVENEIKLIDKDLIECELTFVEKCNFENGRNKYIDILEILERVNEE